MAIQLVKRKPQVGQATPYGQGKHPLKGIIGGMTMGALAGGAAPDNGAPYASSNAASFAGDEGEDTNSQDAGSQDTASFEAGGNSDSGGAPSYSSSGAASFGKAPGFWANYLTHGGAGAAYANAIYNSILQGQRTQGEMQVQGLRGQQALEQTGALGEQERQTEGTKGEQARLTSAQSAQQTMRQSLRDSAAKVLAENGLSATDPDTQDKMVDAFNSVALPAAQTGMRLAARQKQSMLNAENNPTVQNAYIPGAAATAAMPYSKYAGGFPTVGPMQSHFAPLGSGHELDYNSIGVMPAGEQSMTETIGPDGTQINTQQSQTRPKYTMPTASMGGVPGSAALPSVSATDLARFKGLASQPTPNPVVDPSGTNSPLNIPGIPSPQPGAAYGPFSNAAPPNTQVPLDYLMRLLQQTQDQGQGGM